MRKLLVKTLLYIAGNPHIPYTIRIYIIRNRWVISVLYHARVRDRLRFTPLSRVVRELEETSSADDAYNTEIADLVERSLEESSTVTDAYSTETADRVERSLEESSSVGDAYSTETADRVERSLAEESSVADGYSVETANRVVRQLQESASAVDQISSQVAQRQVIELEETVRPREVGLEGGLPWDEDPTKKIWTYFDFEKTLVADEYNAYIVKPSLVTTLDAVDVTETEATLRGYLYGDGWVERGFEWGTIPGVYEYEWTETGNFTEGEFTHRITGLEPNTKYYFRAKGRKAT